LNETICNLRIGLKLSGEVYNDGVKEIIEKHADERRIDVTIARKPSRYF
jgi:hypothetical protein